MDVLYCFCGIILLWAISDATEVRFDLNIAENSSTCHLQGNSTIITDSGESGQILVFSGCHYLHLGWCYVNMAYQEENTVYNYFRNYYEDKTKNCSGIQRNMGDLQINFTKTLEGLWTCTFLTARNLSLISSNTTAKEKLRDQQYLRTNCSFNVKVNAKITNNKSSSAPISPLLPAASAVTKGPDNSMSYVYWAVGILAAGIPITAAIWCWCRRDSGKTQPAIEAEESAIYDYISVPTVGWYEARAMVAANRTVPSQQPFVPALPARPPNAYENVLYQNTKMV